VNAAGLRSRLVAVMRTVAPEIDEATLAPDRPLRDQVDLDSMDWLRVIVAIHEKLGVDIPESDYPRLRTLDDWVRYLQGKESP